MVANRPVSRPVVTPVRVKDAVDQVTAAFRLLDARRDQGEAAHVVGLAELDDALTESLVRAAEFDQFRALGRVRQAGACECPA